MERVNLDDFISVGQLDCAGCATERTILQIGQEITHATPSYDPNDRSSECRECGATVTIGPAASRRSKAAGELASRVLSHADLRIQWRTDPRLGQSGHERRLSEQTYAEAGYPSAREWAEAIVGQHEDPRLRAMAVDVVSEYLRHE